MRDSTVASVPTFRASLTKGAQPSMARSKPGGSARSTSVSNESTRAENATHPTSRKGADTRVQLNALHGPTNGIFGWVAAE